MVGTQTLKHYLFSSMEEYFEYIILSKMNGQLKQAKYLIDKFSKEQKKEFLFYLETRELEDEDVTYCRRETISSF